MPNKPAITINNNDLQYLLPFIIILSTYILTDVMGVVNKLNYAYFSGHGSFDDSGILFTG